MDSAPVFLHVTDTHLRDNSTYDPNRSDLKVHLQGMSETSRESLFSSTLKALAEKLKAEGIALDGVIFSGDGNLGADTSGMLVLKTMLLDHLSGVGVCAENIVAVPGNHDVKKNTFPGSHERYENFVNTWRAGGKKAKTPFLFDIDEDDEGQDFSENILRSNAGHWAVLPMNSSNWSHSKRDDMSSEFIEKMDKLIGRAARKDRKALTENFNKLFEYDAAFISGEQLDKAREILQRTDPENSFRIAVLHHHLLPVNRRVEAKPYGDLIDLGAFRQFIRENKIRVIIHGHKHSTAAFYDHIYDDKNNAGQPHRVLILSGGTFGDGTGNDDPFRLIEFENLRFAPKCKITPVPLVQPGGGLSLADPLAFSLWETERCETTPILVQGSDINTVYNRACQVAENEVATRPMLICKLDIDGKEGVDLFPDDYPEDDHVNCKAWFESIVRWWQLPHSRIEKRIPYIHGARLNRYGGNIDQLSRIARLLKDKTTTKAVAVLVDPKHDFGDDKQDFASFCLVQFSVRTAESNAKFLDCVSYYRAQEFRRWWPVNVAELKEIMNRICRDIDSRLGSITTIAADPRFSLPKKVPTKVSVPTIDQWVDTDPGRIHLISTALLDKDGVLISDREKVMVDWNLCLNEIAITGEEYPSDGIPVAIDGLELLMECLKSAKSFHKADAAEGARIESLCSDLRSLIYANKGFEDKEDRGQNFENWKNEIDQLLARIRANSAFKDV